MRGKKCVGSSYEFIVGREIGSGGNGSVHLVNNLKPKIDKDYVVKILSIHKWKNKDKKKKRYERFKKEINTVIELEEKISGLMEIVDFYYPDDLEGNEDVWYIMPKAQGFKQFSKDNHMDIKKKIEYSLELCGIICDLHDRGYSHRDIKVDNLLVLNNRLKLADFGLIWNIDDNRITTEGERLGPYYIGPPELENRNISINDFRPSDVYLFSKLVWEVIKNDYIGFRGQYKRDNGQFYLNPKEYGVSSFEPLHQLLEQSTKFNMNERIDINNCKELLIDQLLIIDEGNSSRSLTYRYNELQMEVLNRYEPEERIYRDFNTINYMLKQFTPISRITIEGANEEINATQVNSWKVENSFIFKSKSNGELSYSYLFYPDYIRFSKDNEGFELYIKKVQREEIHSGFISFNESRRVSIWGIPNTNIFLDEPLVIHLGRINVDV